MTDLSAMDSSREEYMEEVRKVEEGLFATPFNHGTLNSIYRIDQPSINKDWHADITSDIRQHIVVKLVRAIFPSPDPAAMHDQRFIDLVQYAKKVEKDFVDNSESREEYCRLVAEKVYKMRKQIQEKKAERLAEAAKASNIPHPV